MHDGALNDALKSQRRLGIDFAGSWHCGRVVADKISQRLAQIVNIYRTGAQNFGSGRIVQQCQQQMLDRNEFMTCLSSFDKGHV
jgi:hypothetical protein